jgi:hypothetical protein
MGVPTNWTELKTEVALWADHTVVTTNVDTFIGYAEARFNRRLRVPEMEAAATATISAGSYTLPANFLALRSIYIDSNPDVVLSQVTPARLREVYPTTSTGTPAIFAMQEALTLLVAPSPDASYSAVINYWGKIPALGASTATNWLLTTHPDLYLAATLAESFLFMRDEQRASIWDSRTEAKIDELNWLGARKAASQAPVKLRADLPLNRATFDITRG